MMKQYYYQDGGGIIDWFMSLFSDDAPKQAATKAPKLPGKYKINDLRKVSRTTGRPIDPRTELVSGEYDGERIENIVKAAKRYGLDPYTAVAIDLQETGLGNRSEGRMGHSLLRRNELIPTKMESEEEADDYDLYARSIATKMKYADKLGIKDPYVRLQAYNGLGKIFPETEQNYHGFKMKKIYGVPVPKTGIDMRKNPLYGKRVSDLRDNILRKDKVLDAYIRSVKQKGGAVVSPYGQWEHPGKDTIVPTPSGKITMKGVPYPVYGRDETGYGQMMYPDGQYRFPGKMVYEVPMIKKGDSTLENILEVFDPTGISSWDDVYRSYKETGMSPETALEIFGALPFLGKVGKTGKMLGDFGKFIAVTNRQKRNAKFAGNLLQAIPYIGRGTDILQTVQQAPTAPVLPFASGGQHGGLDRWFAEKWVDVKTGKACGRQEGENRRSYPACRPSRRVSEDTPKTASELSSSEREKFKRSKTSSERINYQHRRQELGGEQTENDMANKPNNPALWSRAKSLAKQKFDVYPSAYANGWAAKWYKGKGGTWSKAEYGMEVMENGGTNNPGFKALPEYVQAKILSNMAAGGERMPAEIARARFAAAGNLDQLDDYGYGYGGYIPDMMAYGGAAQQAAIAIAMKEAGKKPKSMAQGGEPNGEMALGQMAAVQDKMNKLLQFVKPNDNLDPWIASKLAVMDHSADAIADYMMYGPEAEEQMDEMANGGYTVTRSNDRKGKTHKVTGPDGTVKYFGDAKLGQHPKDPERKKAFYARHKKNLANNPYFRAFARETWAEGGYVGQDGKRHMSTTPTWSGNMGYEMGGIHIDPKNKGKFTAAANQRGMGVQEFAAQVLQNPDAYSSTMVKRANFARNAAQWKKQVGGWHSEWNQDDDVYIPVDDVQEQFDQDVAATAAPMVALNVPAAAMMAPAPARRAASSNYSIVDYLNSKDLPSDYATRKALAEQNGISGYRGTAEQNLMLLSMLKKGTPAASSNASADEPVYNFSDGNVLRSGYNASTANPFMFGQMPQRVAAAPAASVAKKVNAANAKDAEEAMTFAKYQANDPYFFAEESDPMLVKAIDAPFAYMRNLGARMYYDHDPMAIMEALSLGAGRGFLTNKLAGVIDKFRGAGKAAATVSKMSPAVQKTLEQAKRANLVSNQARKNAMEAAQRAPRVRFPDPTKSATLSPAQRAAAAAKKSPGTVSAPRTRALPNQMRRQAGGPVVGQEMEVTPEQLEQLRAQGYQFEII